jgi:tetratricopeptide (TPR) repeat protein
MTQTGPHLRASRLARDDLGEGELAHLEVCLECRHERMGIREWFASTASSEGSTLVPWQDEPLPQPAGPREGQRIGSWVIERPIGQGGMATVYLARHWQLGNPVALKLLRHHIGDHAQRLVREGQLQANLQHPNVLAVHDVQLFDDTPTLVLEYVDGPDLRRRIRSGPSFHLAQVDAIVRGVLEGMQAAHTAGFVHRDLKPSNVLLAGSATDPLPKVSDFGIAKVLGSGPGGLTGSRILGTPEYMAPEQFRRADSVDHRADIYALGCMFYELVTGQPLRQGRDWVDILHRAESGEHLPVASFVPDIPPRIVAAIESALLPDVDLRPSSCEELLAIWDGRHPGTTPAVGALVRIELRVEGTGHASALREICAHDAAAAQLDQHFHARPLDPERPDGLLVFPTVAEAVGYARKYRELLQYRSADLTVRCDLRTAVRYGPLDGAPEIVERLVSLAGRDRILLASSTREGPGPSLGHYRLAGLSEPLELFEPPSDGMRRPEPPADTETGWRVAPHGAGWRPVREVSHNLPPEPARLVGRERELLELERWFEGGGRTVCLQGADGLGKTTLAVHFAWSTLGWWPGGAWFIDLARVRGATELTDVLTRTIEPLLDEVGAEPDDLGACLARLGRCLLVLDRAEQLEPATLRMLEQWLDEAPEVRLVAIAQQGLGDWAVARAFALGGLKPAAGGQLLEDRGSRAGAQLAELLGGSPLAIELVACAGAPLPELHEVLQGRPQALSATLSWVWGRLFPWERSALAQSTVFEGGMDTHAADKVLDLSMFSGAPPTGELLSGLWARKLLVAAGEERYDLHPAVRTFAAQRLRAPEAFPGSGGALARSAEARHAAFFGRPDAPLDDRRELENFIVACRRSIRAGQVALATHTCARVCEVVGETGPAVDLAAGVLGMAGLPLAARARLVALAARGQWIVAELARASSASPGKERPRARRDRVGPALQAIASLRQALQLFRDAGQPLGAAVVARRLGDIHRLLRRGSDARADYQLALDLYQQAGHAQDAALLRQLAAIAHESGQLDQARKEYEAALIAASRSEPQAVGDIQVELARVEHDAGRHAQACQHLQEARKEREVTGDRVGAADVERYLSELEREIGLHAPPPRAPASPEPPRPLETDDLPDPDGVDWLVSGRRRRDRGQLGMALMWFSRVREPSRRPRALCETGALHRMRGDLDQAISSYQMAISACRREPSLDPSSGEEARRALAELYDARERRLDVREHLEAALVRHRESGACVEEGKVRGQLALHHQQHGEVDAAILHCERALELHRLVGDTRAEAVALGNLGNLQYEVGRWDRASALYQEALELHREVGQERACAGVASNLAHLLHHAGHPQDAASWYGYALGLYRRLHEPARLARALVNLADLERSRGELAAAERWLGEAAVLSREVGEPRLEAVLLAQRGALRARAESLGASELFEAAVATLCAHPDPISLGWVLLARAEVALDQGRSGLGHELLDEISHLLPRAGAPLQARIRPLRDRSPR